MPKPVVAVVVALVVSALACSGDDRPRVLIRDRLEQPVEGAHVRAIDARGVIADVLTGADGVADVALAEGGWVTAADVELRTFRSIGDVAEDDHLTITLPTGPDLPPRTAVAMTIPPLPPGAATFDARARCAATQVNGLEIDPRCADAGATTVYLTAYDDAHRPVAYLRAPGVDLHQPAVDIAGEWRTGEGGTTALVLPALSPGTWRDVFVSELVDGFPVAADFVAFDQPDAGTLAYVPVGDHTRYRLTTSDGRLFAAASADRASFVVAPADLLPPLSNLVLAGTTVAWQGGGGGDSLYAGVIVHQGSGDVIVNEQTWTMTTAPGVTHVTFPPDPDFVWPSGSMGTVEQIWGGEIESSTYASYDDVRGFDGALDDDGIPLPAPDDLRWRRSGATERFVGP